MPVSIWIFGALCVVFHTVGESLMNSWAKSPEGSGYGRVVAGYLASAIGATCYIQLLLAKVPLSVANAIMCMVLTLSVVAVGVFLFGDDLLPRQKIGIALAMVAIVLLRPR